MRRLALDVREALSDHPTGKGQWVRGFVDELSTRNFPLMLIGRQGTASRWSASHITYRQFPRGWGWHMKTARTLLRQRDTVVYFSPTSFIVPFLVGGSVPTIPLIHDLIAFRREPHDRKAQWIEQLTLRRALSVARHVCTISEATKHDLLNRYPTLKEDALSVLYAGPFSSAPLPNNPDQKTILSLGTLCPRKNQLRLIRAYASLPEDLRKQFSLVLAGGRGWDDAEIIRLAERTPGVTWQGYVKDAEYERLLSSATVLAFPSLYEGFGMPVLDALQRGLPVLTSKRGSLPEVAGEAAAYVDPESEASIANGLAALLRDAGIRSALREAGMQQAQRFSWKRTVDIFLSLLQPLL